MAEATKIRETEHGIVYKIGVMEFLAEDYGDIADHVNDWNENPVAWLAEEIYELLA